MPTMDTLLRWTLARSVMTLRSGLLMRRNAMNIFSLGHDADWRKDADSAREPVMGQAPH
jgi:hypothetical protein